jgi:Xaa-Pro dipeptidase
MNEMTSKQPHAEAYTRRLEKLRKLAADNGLEGIVLVPGPNLRYYTNVCSFLLERPFLFFAGKEGPPHLVAPTLESGPYLRSPIEIVVHSWDDGAGPSKAIEETVEQLGVRGKWGLEGKVPYQYIDALLKVSQPQLENAEPILQGIRALKEKDEVKLLQRAASILSKSFMKIPDLLQTGMSELDLARKITERISLNGAASAQDVLVQSGAMAADGHHQASAKKMRRNEAIVVDAACTFSGYFADITRTFIIGKDPTFEDLYQNVLGAHEAAINASQPGATAGSIDYAARSHFQKNGLDKYFVHRIGHGLGLEVHEAPYIVPGGNDIVDSSMVFTIEPGVYMKGKMGIRIEDDILLTGHGASVLTKLLPNEFGWWR